MVLDPRKQLQNAAPTRLKGVFEIDTITAFEEFIEPELLEAFADLDADSLQELTDLAGDALIHRGSKNEAFLKRLEILVGENYRNIANQSLDDAATIYGVPLLFRGDLTGFTNAALDQEFNKSLTRRELIALRKHREPKDLNALDWAIKTTAKGAVKELERVFGNNYKHILRGLKNRRTITHLRPNEIRHYDDIMETFGINDYTTLAKENERFGHLFEVDHLLEQRFWRNNPNVVSAFDEHGLSFAYLVPKNPHIAALLQKDVPKGVPRIKYVHTVKTKSLKDLIPHGKESLYSVQQIWDAHILTFDGLGFNRSEYIVHLEGMFKEYVDGLKLSGTQYQGGKLVDYPNITSFPNVADFFLKKKK